MLHYLKPFPRAPLEKEPAWPPVKSSSGRANAMALQCLGWRQYQRLERLRITRIPSWERFVFRAAPAAPPENWDENVPRTDWGSANNVSLFFQPSTTGPTKEGRWSEAVERGRKRAIFHTPLWWCQGGHWFSLLAEMSKQAPASWLAAAAEGILPARQHSWASGWLIAVRAKAATQCQAHHQCSLYFFLHPTYQVWKRGGRKHLEGATMFLLEQTRLECLCPLF